MKKLIAIFCLLSCSITQAASWIQTGSSDDVVMYTYDEIQTVGPYKRAWNIQDNLRNKTSYKAFSEYDCIQKRYRLLELISYSGPYASGERNVHPVKNQWTYVPPNTIAEASLNFICR